MSRWYGRDEPEGIVGAEQVPPELVVNASNQPVVDNISTGTHEPEPSFQALYLLLEY
jgi:hypothetical protein